MKGSQGGLIFDSDDRGAAFTVAKSGTLAQSVKNRANVKHENFVVLHGNC